MAIKIQELNHVALHVSDLETSIRFYGEVLGFGRSRDPPLIFRAPGLRWAIRSCT